MDTQERLARIRDLEISNEEIISLNGNIGWVRHNISFFHDQTTPVGPVIGTTLVLTHIGRVVLVDSRPSLYKQSYNCPVR